MDFVVPTQVQWSQIRGLPDQLETTTGVKPLTFDERVKFGREVGERRQAWRQACEAHLADLMRVYPR